MNVAQFTSNEDSATRDLLRRKFYDGDYLQALVAIKCLDEGVNIPAIKTAFILASTTFRGNMMKIMKVEVASDAFCVPHPAGTVAKIEDDKFFIATSKGLVVPTVMQFGSFFMGDSKDFIRIVNPKIGEEFK